MSKYDSTIALHQQVREYVEKEEPEYKVTCIDEYATTNYLPTMQSQYEISPANAEFVLAEVKMRFRVQARYLASNRRLSCEVYVTNNDKLYMGDRLVSR